MSKNVKVELVGDTSALQRQLLLAELKMLHFEATRSTHQFMAVLPHIREITQILGEEGTA